MEHRKIKKRTPEKTVCGYAKFAMANLDVALAKSDMHLLSPVQ